MNAAGTKPEAAFKVGAVRVAIWTNPRMTNGGRPFSSHKVIVERTYRDSDQRFKSTNSLDAGDIPKAILALFKAYEYILCGQPEKDDLEGEMTGFSSIPK